MANDREGVSASTWFKPKEYEEIEEFLRDFPDKNRAELLREGAIIYARAWRAAVTTGWEPSSKYPFRHHVTGLIHDEARKARQEQAEAGGGDT